MNNNIYVLNFKIGEKEKNARNWEQQTQADYCEKIIDTYKEQLDKCFEEWKDTNYDNYFEEMDVLTTTTINDFIWFECDDFIEELKEESEVEE